MLGEKAMADEIVTRQQLVDAGLDAESLQKFISGLDSEDVLTRLGQIYPTLAKLVRMLMETGGWKAYSTEAELLATIPTVNPSVGYAFDTKKLYKWNGTAWIDEGLSQLDLSKKYTDSLNNDIKKILYELGSQQLIGAATISANANYGTTPVTVAFANPVLVSGKLTKLEIAVNSPTSAIKLRVFEKTGNTLSVIKEQVLNVSTGTIEYQLVSPIDVQAGQFLGWYAVGGTIKSIRDGGVYPATYPANGDVISIDASVSYTEINWQIKFTVDQAGVYPLIGEMEKDIAENKTNLEILEALTATGDIVNYGRPEDVVIGSITASKKYIPFVRQIEVGGELIKAKFSLKMADSVGFFVARMIAANTLQITQETNLVSFGAGIHEFTLGSALKVESGDYIGWKTSNNQVSFVSATADDLGYFSATHDASLNRLIIDGTYTSSQPQMQMTVSTKRAKGVSAIQLTQAEYDALPIKDSNTLYIVSD